MFAAVLYKEFREHRSIWLALAVIGAGVLWGRLLLTAGSATGEQISFIENLAVGAVIVFAWVYGIVCGSMLLAGESEGGTQGFLDTLPISRIRLWFGKVLAGSIFVFLQLAFLTLISREIGLLHLFRPGRDSSEGLVAMMFFGVSGFGWGLLLSAVSSSVLTSIGLAIVFQIISSVLLHFLVLMILALVSMPFGQNWADSSLPLILTSSLLLVLPYLLSALLYSRVDLGRLSVRPIKAIKLPRWWSGVWQSLWLSWRQTRGLLIGLMLFSLLAGLLMIGLGLYVSPIATLFIGALCGATTFLDEQRGARGFLAAQRFSLGRIWLVKVGVRLFIVFFCSFLVYVPLVISWEFRSQGMYRNPNDGPVGMALILTSVPVGPFFILWPAFGFALGIVCGLLFRNPLVSLVVSVGLSVLFISVWVPSLVLGGLYLWQIIGVPLVLLGCSRLLMYPWATDELFSWTVARRVGGTVLLCAALTVLGLWYRVVEFPDTPEPEDFQAFLHSLPSPEENKSGRLVRDACARLVKQSKEWTLRRPVGPDRPINRPAQPEFLDECKIALSRGWPDGDVELEKWLDHAFADDWWQPLQEASREPTGVVDDPRMLTYFDHSPFLTYARKAAVLLAARGLQLQKTKGDPTVFIDHFEIALSLVRNLQNHGRTEVVTLALGVEADQMEALARWLEQLAGRPDLLARAAAILHRHRELSPADSRDERYVEYLIALNTVDQPERWIQRTGMAHQDEEISFLSGCWYVPWEADRRMRLLRTLYWGEELKRGSFNYKTLSTVPAWMVFHGRIGAARPRRLVSLGVAELILALRRFQAETGKPADQLTQLVPKYLERLPEDPFDSRPLRYRLSRGEMIFWGRDEQLPINANAPARSEPSAVFLGFGPLGFPVILAPSPYCIVPAGQGILWSIGEDLQDNGAKRQSRWSTYRNTVGEDMIYLVPLPARKRP